MFFLRDCENIAASSIHDMCLGGGVAGMQVRLRFLETIPYLYGVVAPSRPYGGAALP